jgi:hypothetical protein
LPWSVEKLPAGNFLDFSFFRARAGPRGFQQASQAIRPERIESRKLPAGNLAGAIHHGVVDCSKTGLLRACPKLTGRFFWHLMMIFADEGHGKRVSRCIRILSDKARHELVIMAKHGRDSLVVIATEECERLKWRDRRVGLRLSRQRSGWKPSALPKGPKNLRTSTPSLSDRFGASLTCPRPHHPLELRLE